MAIGPRRSRPWRTCVMALIIETPEGGDALAEFVRFFDEVYAARAIRWPALVPF